MNSINSSIVNNSVRCNLLLFSGIIWRQIHTLYIRSFQLWLITIWERSLLGPYIHWISRHLEERGKNMLLVKRPVVEKVMNSVAYLLVYCFEYYNNDMKANITIDFFQMRTQQILNPVKSVENP